ncbi:MAG: hypothetical protein NZ805_11510 [Armatimonadetes bacterium]|nr:hypothetical protein [Armatimonadota bacterium]MDW8026796.1 hypothetical protein [Armatimonadota bacterium]
MSGTIKIRKQYVVNENNEPVAMQIDIETFRRLERLLEDYALGKLIEAVESEKPLFSVKGLTEDELAPLQHSDKEKRTFANS